MKLSHALAVFGILYLNFSMKSGLCGEPRVPLKPNQKTRIIKNVPYVGLEQGKAHRHQTLDLYFPPPAREKPPLLVFVHGGFWTMSDNEVKIGPSLAADLAESGVAVALIRYRLGPQHRHPDQVRDVATAVSYLFRSAPRYGYDPKRLYLAGQSAGAQLVSLVALDERYLAVHSLAPNSIAGIIGISGIYNLVGRGELSTAQQKAIQEIFGHDAAILRDASPITHVKPGAPPFLLLSGSSDFTGFSIDARRFAEALNQLAKQKPVPLVISGRDHLSMVRLDGVENLVRDLVLDFLKIRPLPSDMANLIEAKRAWLESAPSTLPFWKRKELVRSYPIDQRFLYMLISVYGPLKHELLQWPLGEFHAIDLLAYLDALPTEQVGKGEHLIITNLRNEKQFWRRRDIEPYQPVIVVGIDDQRNLFDMSVFYRMQREYSWKSGPQPPTMARPLGAFIYFLKAPPPELRPESWLFALTENSFRLRAEDPLAPLNDLPRQVYEVMTFRNGCVYCHSFRGVGSRSHHMLASGGAGHGGFALPLENYSREALKAFIFDQEAVADKMGANPNIVEESARQAVYEFVLKYRRQQHGSEK